jgi:hypothetical protein
LFLFLATGILENVLAIPLNPGTFLSTIRGRFWLWFLFGIFTDDRKQWRRRRRVFTRLAVRWRAVVVALSVEYLWWAERLVRSPCKCGRYVLGLDLPDALAGPPQPTNVYQSVATVTEVSGKEDLGGGETAVMRPRPFLLLHEAKGPATKRIVELEDLKSGARYILSVHIQPKEGSGSARVKEAMAIVADKGIRVKALAREK